MMLYLHMHHSGEDRGLWPLVRELNPTAGPLLDTMDADHARIAPEIDRVAAAAIEYRTNPAAREIFHVPSTLSHRFCCRICGARRTT